MTTKSEQDSQLPARERAELLVDTLLESGVVWGLMGETGWLMVENDHKTCLPIWPDEEAVKFWQRKDLPTSMPQAISLKDFVETWLPGLQKNNVSLVMFPAGTLREGLITSADELRLQLVDEAD